MADEQTTIVPVYHVTFAGRLPTIARHGLLPNARSGFGGGAYDFNKKGRIFVTEKEGIDYWFNKARDHAFDASDNVWKDGLVPVVLAVAIQHRFEKDGEVGGRFRRMPGKGRMISDELGSSDALHDAWYTTKTIPATRLKVFNGRAWVPIDRFRKEDAAKAVKKVREDGTSWYELIEPSPLQPFVETPASASERPRSGR